MALAKHRLQQLPHAVNVLLAARLAPCSTAAGEELLELLVLEPWLLLGRAGVAQVPTHEPVRLPAAKKTLLQSMRLQTHGPIHMDLLQTGLHFAGDPHLVLAAAPRGVRRQAGGLLTPVRPPGSREELARGVVLPLHVEVAADKPWATAAAAELAQDRRQGLAELPPLCRRGPREAVHRGDTAAIASSQADRGRRRAAGPLAFEGKVQLLAHARLEENGCQALLSRANGCSIAELLGCLLHLQLGGPEFLHQDHIRVVAHHQPEVADGCDVRDRDLEVPSHGLLTVVPHSPA